MKIYWKSTHLPQAIHNVDEFFIIRRHLEKCNYIILSTMDSLQWMGAVRMRIQTADKNIK